MCKMIVNVAKTVKVKKMHQNKTLKLRASSYYLYSSWTKSATFLESWFFKVSA